MKRSFRRLFPNLAFLDESIVLFAARPSSPLYRPSPSKQKQPASISIATVDVLTMQSLPWMKFPEIGKACLKIGCIIYFIIGPLSIFYRVVQKSWCQVARKVQPSNSQPRPAMPGWCLSKQSLFTYNAVDIYSIWSNNHISSLSAVSRHNRGVHVLCASLC